MSLTLSEAPSDHVRETQGRSHVIAEDGTQSPTIEPAFPGAATAVPVVMCFNRRYMPGGAALIASIAEHASPNRLYDLIVFADDLASEDRDMLRNVCDRPNISLRFFDVSRCFDGIKFITHFHFRRENAYRLKIPDLMRDFDKVVYIDADTITNRDLADLYDIDVDEYYIAAVRDFAMIATQNKKMLNIVGKKINYETYVKDYLGLNGISNYFNSGLVLFNINKINGSQISERLISLLGTKLFVYVDQDILNIVFEYKVKLIDYSWNMVIDCERLYHLSEPDLYARYLDAGAAPHVVHYIGGNKPWNDPTVHMAEYYWRYAAKTPLYEKLLREIRERRENSGASSQPERKMHPGLRSIRSSAQIIGYMLFPIGKRRRKKRKAILKFARERCF
jgi:lipopolysaccharide biosynthesis glycosyltransferase